MAKDGKLIPVFVPALGAMLIRAEDAKGSPLSEVEARGVRDKSVVIMLTAEDAAKMDERRGYRDVDPENLWSDWQTLRDALGRTPSLPAGPRFDRVQREDEQLLRAAADARQSLPLFRSLLKQALTGGAVAMIKTRLTDGENRAFLWLMKVTEVPTGFQAVVF